MKTYTPLAETDTYRDLYNDFNEVANGLNDVDFLYKSNLSDGRLFSSEVGYVNLQTGLMFTNITIANEDLGNFKIRGFVYYTRKYNSYKVMDINCDLTLYKDAKPHFLYVLLETGGTYEVYDSMQVNTENRMLFARFIIGTDGNSIQFYLMAPFAGSPDYIKGNPFYNVTEGIKVYGKEDSKITFTNGKIRFPGINFDNQEDPDVVSIQPNGVNKLLRYISWDSTNSIPTVDWASGASYNVDFAHKINYTTGAISTVTSGKYTVQKVLYDILTETCVIMYGDTEYDTLAGATIAASSILNYPLIDNVKYLLPISVMISYNGNTDLSDTDVVRFISILPDEAVAFGSDLIAQQMALQAINTANTATTTANTASTNLSNHIANITNPHQVTVVQVGLDNSYTEYTPASIIAEAQVPLSLYLLKTGGTISGNLAISGTLGVTGTSTLGVLNVGSLSTFTGASSFNNNVQIGTSLVNRILNLYGNENITGNLSVSNTATISNMHSTSPYADGGFIYFGNSTAYPKLFVKANEPDSTVGTDGDYCIWG